MNQIIQIPENFKEYIGPPILDGEDINYTTKKKIQDNDLWAVCASPHFFGKVWYENFRWLCQIYVDGVLKETVVCEKIERLYKLTKNKGRGKIYKPTNFR